MIAEALSRSLAPGECVSFTLKLDTHNVGTFAGEISIGANDSDENPLPRGESLDSSSPSGHAAV
jgi:hypothetical protein